MAAGRKIVIEFLGKDNTARSVASVENRYSKLGTKMQRIGRAAGLGLAAGLALTARAAVDAGKAAAEDEAAQSRLAQTLKTAAGATKGSIAQNERFITSMGKQFGVADDQLRPALGRLAVATGDVGKAQSLAMLAMDVSAGSGKSLESVTMALAKAQNGNLGALGRLGIKIKDTDGKTKSLDQITKELAKTYDGAASKAADTTAGKQKKLTQQYGELKEQIGAGLLPVMQKLTEVGLKVVNFLQKNPTVLVAAAAAFAGLAAAVGLLAAQFAIAFIAANAIPIAIGAIVVRLIYAYKHFETFRKIVDVVAKAVYEAFRWLWNNGLRPVLLNIAKGFGLLMMGWGKMLQALGKVPGFGWAKKAGDAMMGAGEKAMHLGDYIKEIPSLKDIKFKSNADSVRRSIEKLNGAIRGSSGGGKVGHGQATHYSTGYGGGKTPASAGGTNFHPGGMGWVGEDGPELLKIRRGSQVLPNDMVSGAGGKGGGDTYNISVNGFVGSETQLATAIQQLLLKKKRVNGAALGLA